MIAYRIAVAANGRPCMAAVEVPPGPKANGSFVYDVVDCPEDVHGYEVITLAAGVLPPWGVTAVPYDRLLARRSPFQIPPVERSPPGNPRGV